MQLASGVPTQRLFHECDNRRRYHRGRRTPSSLLRRISIGIQDYSLTDDIASGDDTPVIYAWRAGEGIGKHTTSQRGSVLVNFKDGTLTSTCDGTNDYYALHGALLLVAWLLFAPYGLYQAR